MSKGKRGRKLRKGELAKREQRIEVRKQAWRVTGDGAGARSIDAPARHHRKKSR